MPLPRPASRRWADTATPTIHGGKIKRDVRIMTIGAEGTSKNDLLEMTISRDRWQLHLKTRGQHYHEQAKKFEALHASHPSVGADSAALATRLGRSDEEMPASALTPTNTFFCAWAS